jgi:hypothetical protein
LYWVFRDFLSFISKGENIVKIAENIRHENSELKVKDYDTLITLCYAIFAIAFLVIIYAASMAAGTPPGEFASMTVFP